MEEEYVVINNVPLKVSSWGGYTPSKIKENPNNKPKELILVIPGNPGVVEFYDVFLNRLYENVKKPIWIVSHGGHNRPRDRSLVVPSLKTNRHLYDLNGQIEQKIEFIKTYLDGVNIKLIGHSIGCKMILEILNEDNIATKVDKCYLLFPTIERMAATENGKFLIFSLQYLVWLLILGSFLFQGLPYFIQIGLLKIYNAINSIGSHNENAMMCLIRPSVLRHVFYLAENEMAVVKDLDDDIISKHQKKLYLYYSESDGWTPLTYYRELKNKYSTIDAHVCTRGFQHAFVLNSSEKVADFVGELLSEKEENSK